MLVRNMQVEDSEQVAILSDQLGYPANAVTIEERFHILSRLPENAMFVAEDEDGLIIGWAHVCGIHLLESEGYAEVGGLVTDCNFRRRGIGRALMQAVEEWSKANGFTNTRLRSGMHREEAHLFYTRIGYEAVKTSMLFRKNL